MNNNHNYFCTIMENVKSLCRVCLNKGSIDIFSGNYCDGLTIGIRLNACTSLLINCDDGFPPNICSTCLSDLDIAYNFRQKCHASEVKLQEVLRHSIKIEHNTTWDNDVCDFDEDVKSIPVDGGLLKTEIKSETRENQSNKINIEKSKPNTNKKKLIKLVTHSKMKYNMTVKSEKSCRKSPTGKKMNSLINRKNHITREKIKRNAPLSKIIMPKDTSMQECEPEKSSERDKSRNHMCTTCGKTFLYLGNLLDHERVHTGDKPYNCEICDRRFSQTGHLLVHQRTHSGVKPYQCEICPRAFSVSHALKKHLRTHTGERPYACTMCSKSFVTSYHLSNHFKRHTGEKEFKCDFPDCNCGFVNISEMKRHRARHDKPKDLTKTKINNSSKSIPERYQSMSASELQSFAAKILPNNIKMNNEFRKYLDSIFQHTENEIQ